MPNQAIDLMRGCEAWYDLDPRYYDNQRGVLADKSGHGRTAEAQGGPTVGVNGYRSFAATAFDGSDDHFDADYPELASPGTGSLTMATMVRPTPTSDIQYAFALGNQSGGAYDVMRHVVGSDGSYTIIVQDGTDGVQASDSATTYYDQWVTAVGVLDRSSDTLSLHIDGEVLDVVDASAIDGITNSTYNVRLGFGSNGDANYRFVGSMTFGAVWHRALSMAEIQAISRLSGPVRSL